MATNGHGNGNGAHYHAASQSAALSPAALDKSKHLASSPHKLMMGVPPAATPSLPSAPNGTSSHLDQPPHDAHHANGNANGSSAVVAADAKGKQKQLDPIDTVPLAQLEQELPLEESDLVSLAALVERLANYGYESLQNLAETLPSLPSSSKRAKIFNTALDVRKQFIKLLVLSRWSKDVADLQKSRNIIALLSEQQWQHEDVFAGLTDIRKILPNARMRNADLPTAIDVLQTGTYRRLPSSIKDMAVATKPFTDQQALSIVTRLEDALRTRMACRELVPAPLSNYSIRDGKVHFNVPGLFGAQLTASSGGQDSTVDGTDNDTASSTDDRWWLLDLGFDVSATGSCAESSTRAFPRKPKKAYRERLRVWGDQELAPRSQSAQSDAADDAKPDSLQSATGKQVADEKPTDEADSKETGQPAEIAEQNESATVKGPAERDAPLSRLFAFLQERSLHYQMDILQHQAYELCRLNWGSNLRVETAERPRRLTLHYWTQAQGAAGASQRAQSPAAGGSVQITIVDLPDRPGASKTLAMLLDDDSNATSQTEARTSPVAVKRRGLQVTWDAHASILADADTSNLAVSPHSLDVESLLSLVIKRHTSALLRNLQRRILVSDHAVSRLLRPEDCTLCVEHAQRQGDEFSTATEATSFSFLQIELRRSSRPRSANAKQGSTSGVPPLRLSVDAVSGRLLLDSETTQAATTDLASASSARQAATFTASILTTRPTNARLTEASDRINESMEAIFDVLYRLEVFARVEEWERMASYLGLRAVRKLNLRAQDLVKFGPSTSASPEAAPQLFIPLRNSFPGYFLALQPSELAGATIALVYIVQVMEATGAPTLTVQSIEWLDRAKIAAASKAGSGGHDDVEVLGAAEAGQKRKDAPGGLQGSEADANFGKRDLTMEELGDVHSYCIALVSYFRVEQQLRMRGIPYLHVGSNTSRSSPPAKRLKRLQSAGSGPPSTDARDDGLFDEEENGGAAAVPEHGTDALEDEATQVAAAADTGVAALVPSLCLRATDLLGPARSHLTKPNVSLRIRNWDDSDKCCVQMRIKLRMKSRRFRALHEVVSVAPTSDKHTTSPLTWIDFDNETSLLTLSTRDLDNCIPTFYTQWERVMRMVQLTREVLNASRAWQQRALRSRISCKKPAGLVELRRFDFDTVIFSYGSIAEVDGSERKLLVRVRWQDARMETQPYTNMPVTQSGGYILEFGSIPTADVGSLDSHVVADAGVTDGTPPGAAAARKDDEAVSKWFDDVHASANPHNAMAFELRRTVNVAARTAAMHSSVQPHSERMVWRGFFKLLQDTLALVREMAPLADKCLSEPDVPEVEIKSATWFRLRFQDRYALDLRLATRSRLIVSDASRALFRSEGQSEQQQQESASSADMTDGELFGGSELLNSLMAGKVPSVDGAAKAKNRTAATAASSQVASTAAAAMQFQPIPSIDSVLRKAQAALQQHFTITSGGADAADTTTTTKSAMHSHTADDGVCNLRRALLISLAPFASSSLKGGQSGASLLSTLVPLLVELVQREIGKA